MSPSAADWGGRRLADDGGRESKVVFRLPYAEVVRMWRRTMAQAYTPEALYARFQHQVERTYPNRPPLPRKVSWKDVKRGMAIIRRVVWTCGIKSDYRATFWKYAWPWIRKGDIERVVAVALVAHHLITFARQASSGEQNASFYSGKLRGAEPTAVEMAQAA